MKKWAESFGIVMLGMITVVIINLYVGFCLICIPAPYGLVVLLATIAIGFTVLIKKLCIND